MKTYLTIRGNARYNIVSQYKALHVSQQWLFPHPLGHKLQSIADEPIEDITLLVDVFMSVIRETSTVQRMAFQVLHDFLELPAADACKVLLNTDLSLFTAENCRRILEHDHPVSIAGALTRYQAAGILTQETFVHLMNHCHLTAWAPIIQLLAATTLLTEVNYERIHHHVALDELTKALFTLGRNHLTSHHFEWIMKHPHPLYAAHLIRLLTDHNLNSIENLTSIERCIDQWGATRPDLTRESRHPLNLERELIRTLSLFTQNNVTSLFHDGVLEQGFTGKGRAEALARLQELNRAASILNNQDALTVSTFSMVMRHETPSDAAHIILNNGEPHGLSEKTAHSLHFFPPAHSTPPSDLNTASSSFDV